SYYGWSGSEWAVPFWVILSAATAMALGTMLGGWRIIQTMGLKVVQLRPIHGFAAETAAATVIEVASRLGIPISTTHTISSAILGVGATRRLSAVRWGVAGTIVTAWVLPLLPDRWRSKASGRGLLYYPTRGLRRAHPTSALYIGDMVSSLVPMRLGELVRAYLIGKTEPVTFSQSVGTVLVEKVLDVVTIL